MADTQTAFAGIIIRTKDTDSKVFVGFVTDALAKLNSKPVGQALLAGIVAHSAKAKFGFTVCIMPKASIKETFGPFRWRKYEVGSVTKAADETASSDGRGGISSLKWDPKSTETPDGARPPFIALAHELIHCYFNLAGTSNLITGEVGKKSDEMRVTGLKGFEQEPISENRIRREHGIAYRVSYHGKCDALEGAPDAALLTA